LDNKALVIHPEQGLNTSYALGARLALCAYQKLILITPITKISQDDFERPPIFMQFNAYLEIRLTERIWETLKDCSSP
jgi:hypothetical protein